MRFVIVTGMSGAGKSTALKMFEDFGYFCVDNLPIPLIKTFAKIAYDEHTDIDNVAIGIDIRNGKNLEEVSMYLSALEEDKVHYEILFLESADEILVKRYKETRRRHPLAAEGRIEDGIQEERQKMAFLKSKASYIIDTTKLLTRELNAELQKIFVQNEDYHSFIVTILSFGFKYGIPLDADMVFDVRFLPNPYYVPALRALTGNQKVIQDYVKQGGEAQEFLNKLKDMILFLIPKYKKEGRNQLIIAIGCTGGKHRSVTMANLLSKELAGGEYTIKTLHKDIEEK
ncbi:MAG: RNase adapter RapZ [Lachnospiraceae bacterium]|nr:RNase adapter RapZ [Lachnospiraceae bacterium]